MKVLAINGSPRKGKNTAQMLSLALQEAERFGAQTELIEISDYKIEYCQGCNKCLRQDACSISDDDGVVLLEKMRNADGILLGSPVYFGNITGQLKTLIDRTRSLHMVRNALQGKVGGALVQAGLRHGGQEAALAFLEKFLRSQGLILVEGFEAWGDEDPRSLFASGTIGTLYKDSDEQGKPHWFKGVMEDQLTVKACRLLGQNMVKMIKILSGTPIKM
ncbi:MAG: flavodoxin family protein [Bacillota bacterium]